MAESASLALLNKGKNKASTGDELKKPETPKTNVTTKAKADAPKAAEQKQAEAAPETAQAAADDKIEIQKMTGTQLDALVKEHSLEVPETWAKMKVQEKKDYLEKKYGDGAQAEADTPAETAAAETPATETKAEAEVEQAPAQEVAVTSGKKKTTGKAAVKALQGEIVAPDMIEDMAHEIENLKEKEARGLVGSLSEHVEVTFFKLGGVLSVISANGWYEPYASFRDFVEKEHEINYRRAMYWVGIYNHLTAAKIPWDKVKAVKWTKLKEIAELLTPENVDEWVEIAMNQNIETLIQTVKNLKAKQLANASGGNPDAQIEAAAESKPIITKAFKLFEDQKKDVDAALAKAKETSGTSSDAVALEYIALEFLGSKAKLPPLADQLKKAGVQAAIAALSEAFPDSNFNIELGAEDAAAVEKASKAA